MNITIEDYSERAIAVFGDTKSIRDRLKNAGGMYNPSLRSVTRVGTNEVETRKPGWTFSIKRKDEIQQLIKDIHQEMKTGTFVSCDNTPSTSAHASSSSSTRRSTKTAADSGSAESQLISKLLSEVELLKVEVANLKKIVLNDKQDKPATSTSSASSSGVKTIPASRSWADEVDESDEDSEESEEEERKPVRTSLLRPTTARGAKK